MAHIYKAWSWVVDLPIGEKTCYNTSMRSHLSKTLVVAFAILLGASAFAKAMADKSRSSRRTKELQEFKAVRYVPNESNDGDSFLVMMGDEEHRVRLYFVDCPETTANVSTRES